MAGKDKRLCILAAVGLLLLMIFVLKTPIKVNAASYSGNGETYNSSSSEAPTSSSEETESSSPSEGIISKEELDGTVSEAKGYLDRLVETTDEIFKDSSYEEDLKEYKTPKWVENIIKFLNKSTISIADITSVIYYWSAGLLIMNAVFAVLSNSYYDWLQQKRWKFLPHSVDLTRQHFGKGIGGGNTNGYGNNTYNSTSNTTPTQTTTTTTTGQNGQPMMSTVTQTAKTLTGPLGMISYLMFHSLVEIAVVIGILLLIKVGVIPFLLSKIITFLFGGLGRIIGMKI